VPNHSATSLSQAACSVLLEPSVEGKISLTQEIAEQWSNGSIADIGSALPPNRPARPARPELLPPRDMPKRNARGDKGRIALIHAIAHIELNAIDLAWDIIARFTAYDLPRNFYADWIGVAVDEARHFGLLANYLSYHGAAYGDFPAHDGLWEAAEDTYHDLLARLAIVPMVLEARGLDTTPPTITKLRDVGDNHAADILATIADEEIAHVAAGVRWFNYICEQQEKEPTETYQALFKKHFKGQLKPPFATAAREQAGFSADYYQPIAAG
tara:strand:- start:634 stop:1443 length:810 start_codon:yes stop_codon:yes gene_type:complete